MRLFALLLLFSPAVSMAQNAPPPGPHDRAEAVKIIAGLRKIVSPTGLTELQDGRLSILTVGMSYQVSDHGDLSHQSSSPKGATLFIVDR